MKDAPYISARSKVSGARRTYEQAARLCEEYAKVVSDFETHGAVPLRPAWADMPHSVASAGAYSRKHQQQLPKERSIWAEREHRAAAVRQAEALLPPEEDFAVRIGIVEGARVLRAAHEKAQFDLVADERRRRMKQRERERVVVVRDAASLSMDRDSLLPPSSPSSFSAVFDDVASIGGASSSSSSSSSASGSSTSPIVSRPAKMLDLATSAARSPARPAGRPSAMWGSEGGDATVLHFSEDAVGTMLDAAGGGGLRGGGGGSTFATALSPVTSSPRARLDATADESFGSLSEKMRMHLHELDALDSPGSSDSSSSAGPLALAPDDAVETSFAKHLVRQAMATATAVAAVDDAAAKDRIRCRSPPRERLDARGWVATVDIGQGRGGAESGEVPQGLGATHAAKAKRVERHFAVRSAAVGQQQPEDFPVADTAELCRQANARVRSALMHRGNCRADGLRDDALRAIDDAARRGETTRYLILVHAGDGAARATAGGARALYAVAPSSVDSGVPRYVRVAGSGPSVAKRVAAFYKWNSLSKVMESLASKGVLIPTAHAFSILRS